LGPKGKTTVDFMIIADPALKAGLYKIPFTLNYADRLEKNYSKSNIISLEVGDIPQLVVNLEDATVRSKDSVGEITVKFVNVLTKMIDGCIIILKIGKEIREDSMSNADGKMNVIIVPDIHLAMMIKRRLDQAGIITHEPFEIGKVAMLRVDAPLNDERLQFIVGQMNRQLCSHCVTNGNGVTYGVIPITG